MKLRWVVFLAFLFYAAPGQCASVPCNGTSSQGAQTSCNSNQTYGVSVGTSAVKILAQDNNRTSLWVQCGGSSGTVLAFNDTAVNSTPYNGFLLSPTASQPLPVFYWTNLAQGNVPGRITASAVSLISLSGTNQCAFMFTQ